MAPAPARLRRVCNGAGQVAGDTTAFALDIIKPEILRLNRTESLMPIETAFTLYSLGVACALATPIAIKTQHFLNKLLYLNQEPPP